MPSLLKNLILFILAALLCFGLYSSRKWLDHENAAFSAPKVPMILAFEPEFLDVVALGHKGLVHDVMEIWLLDKFQSSTYQFDENETLQVIQYLEKHKPRMESVYLFLCFVFLENGKAEYCERVILTGIDVFPESWRLPMTGGFIEMKVFNRPLQAAKYYFLASSKESSPKYVANLAEKLITDKAFSEGDFDQSLKIIFGEENESRFSQFMKQHSLQMRQP
ncbi:MAG: hypothetical protein AB7T49_08745 [Oligoflexales bacterium]